MDFSSGDVRSAILRPAAVGGAGVGSGGGAQLLRGWREFRRSGAPARLLCFEEGLGEWVDVASEAVPQLRQAFQERRVFAEAVYGGRGFLFDFLRMVRIDAATTEEVPLGWIDDRGACFFPVPDSGRKRKRDDAGADDEAESSSGVDEWSGESRGAAGSDGTGKKKKARSAWGDAARLEENERFYQVVSKLFLSYGMGPRGAVITAVRKVAQGARARAFQQQGQLLAAARGAGAGSAKFAWYGAPAEDVAAAVKHGFARANAHLLGARSHGDGVHLAPPQCPYTSAMLAKADEIGEAHIVLCRVLIGRAEAVPAGSSQPCPSSDAYDSAVDNMVNPQWYIVWSKDMNTRILPEYVISFKCLKLQTIGSSEATSKLKKPSPVARDMFPTLLAEIQKFVPSQKCQTLQGTYNCFKRGQMKKDQFIQFLRNYIGDKVLTTVAKKLRGY
ncbi:probable inactive poly [ADP-ribose] polymerase SRO3 [Phragmites australis]|uniref:probable inactive poly [ADP-ribose] polymerase SRO3 n=1 Tax=Phragmites australis TaxID=29695 RepID=UPI002D77F52F|nr:probable inactive poly [ADP-ribose] polymerase SRO3 [Phragmites australis]